MVREATVMSLNQTQIMERNLTLTERHLLSVLNEPQILEGIPHDAHVILLPADDRELLEANLEIAKQLALTLGHNGSRKPIVLLLLPAQEAQLVDRPVVYDLDPTFVRLREDDGDTTPDSANLPYASHS